MRMLTRGVLATVDTLVTQVDLDSLATQVVQVSLVTQVTQDTLDLQETLVTRVDLGPLARLGLQEYNPIQARLDMLASVDIQDTLAVLATRGQR